MIRRPPVGVSDLILAVGRLRPEAATAEDIARLLGLAKTSEDEPVPEPVSPVEPLVRVPDSPELAGIEVATGEPATEGSTTDVEVHVDVERLGRPPANARPAWLDMALAPPQDRAAAETPLELEPLLRPLVSRGILETALRTWHADGPVDSRALVEQVARLQVTRNVPRCLQPTVRNGAQVIVDSSEGMTLFARDAIYLSQSLQRLGGDPVRIRSFDTDPLVAGDGSRRTWAAWEVMRGVPVIAISDLGIGPRQPPIDAAAQWLELAARARGTDAPIVVFVPWSADRWPAPLASAMTLIEWDRNTTIAAVRRRVRTR